MNSKDKIALSTITGQFGSPHGNGTAGKDVYKNLKFIGKWMHKEFNNSLVIPALGNHDSNPPDTFSDRILDSNGASKQYK